MPQQRSLFDVGPPRPPDPVPGKTATSRLAAASMMLAAGSQRRRVYDLLVIRGRYGATRDEICTVLRLGPQTVCPRVKELLTAELIEESDQTRPTRSGRKAAVLRWKGSRYGREPGRRVES